MHAIDYVSHYVEPLARRPVESPLHRSHAQCFASLDIDDVMTQLDAHRSLAHELRACVLDRFVVVRQDEPRGDRGGGSIGRRGAGRRRWAPPRRKNSKTYARHA
jgi:hypothetical protein